MPEIKAVLIFEMLGRPAEHLKSTLEQFIEKIGKEEGIEILDDKISEPKKLEQAQQEIFTTFAETEIKFKDILSLLKIVFIYMPSHIEIISPTELGIKNFDLSTLMSELARKLHQYDEITKRVMMERNILLTQLQQHGIQPAIVLPEQAAQAKQAAKPEKTKKAKKSKKAGRKKKGK